MPRLIGMVSMALPRIINRREDGVMEVVAELGVDETGQLWGLVTCQETVNKNTARLYYDRWVKWDALPFSEDEVVEKSGFNVVVRKRS